MHPDTSAILERRLLMTCDPNRKAWNAVMGPLRDPNPLGALWVADITDGSPTAPRKLQLKGYPVGRDFHPLGFDVSSTTINGVSNLFVTNHARARSTIEQFTLSPSQPFVANYVRTITHRSLIAPNSIALSSNTSFYVTNDHFFTPRLPSILGKTLPIMETWFQFPISFVSHVEIIQEGGRDAVLHHSYPQLLLPFSNGAAVSPDGSELAIASSSMAEVRIFKRIKEAVTVKGGGGKLELTARIPVPFSADNVAYTHDGSKLLIAGHPHFTSLIKVGQNETGAFSPSWVVAVARRDPGTKLEAAFDALAPFPAHKRVSQRALPQHTMRTVFQSTGDASKGGYSSSSSCLWDERHDVSFVSSLFGPGVLYCR